MRQTLLSIFQHLNINDRIRSRRICKRFMLLCDEVRISEVIITTKIENIRGHWFHTNRPFNYSDAIELSTFNALRTKFQLEKFLKRLHFQGDYAEYKQLKLNNFTQLEELKLDVEIPCSVDLTLEYTDINLPNLKIADVVLSRFDVHDLKLVFKTPKLETLKCLRTFSISVAHPETIEHLEVSQCVTSDAMTQSLPNLRCLKFEQDIPDDVDILSKYPRLETLSVFRNQFDSVEYFLATIRHLLEQKRILRRRKLRIYCNSVEMVHTEKIDECTSAKSILEFQMNNYDTLCDNIPFAAFSTFNYNELMELVKERRLPDDFFHKYRNIQYVKVSGEVDQQHLLQFMKRSEYLKKLHLNDAILDQRFFDALPEFSTLTELHMQNITAPALSYVFLLRMKLLEKFTTDHYSTELYDLSLALYKELKYFRRIKFDHGDQIVEILELPWRPNNYMFRFGPDQRFMGSNKNDRIDLEVLTEVLNDISASHFHKREDTRRKTRTRLVSGK